MFRYSYPGGHNKVDKCFHLFIMNKFGFKRRKTLKGHSNKRHGMMKMQRERQIKIKPNVRRNCCRVDLYNKRKINTFN